MKNLKGVTSEELTKEALKIRERVSNYSLKRKEKLLKKARRRVYKALK